jgi:hypothetical protein
MKRGDRSPVRGQTDAPIARYYFNERNIMLNSHRVLSFAFSLCLVGCMDLAEDPATYSASIEQPSAGSDYVVVAPPAPYDAASRSPSVDEAGVSILASSPTITPTDSAPGLDFEYLAPGESATCELRTFCPAVWDPTVGKFKVFKLLRCNRYALSHWNGDGFYVNNQTGADTRTTFYRQNGTSITSFTRGTQPPALVPYDWTPVWFIRNC